MSETIDRTTIRATVREVVHDGPVEKHEVVVRTATRLDIPESAVRDELDALERLGFIYCVGEGDSAEVKLP
jgi:hypothetical protein